MKKLLMAAAVMALSAGIAEAEVKVGMITTLSGGGAGLGIDVRDGFMLALKQSGRDDIEVLIEDDQQKPDVAVQIAENRDVGDTSTLTDSSVMDFIKNNLQAKK